LALKEKTFLVGREMTPLNSKWSFTKGLFYIMPTNGATVAKMGIRNDGYMVFYDDCQDKPSWYAGQPDKRPHSLIMETKGLVCAIFPLHDLVGRAAECETPEIWFQTRS
jgi:hypothetical protein